jgi:glycosyltransferase involved in cell wall biosynthesis
VRVHQVLAGAGPHDAVTVQALRWRARFGAGGWGGGDHATYIVPGMAGRIAPRARLRPSADDVIVLHFSAMVPRLDRLLELPGRLVLVHHNITPARWLWDVAPWMAVQCAAGREQLPVLVRAARACVAVSQFNAADLRAGGAGEVSVIPLLLELDRLGPVAEARTAAPGDPEILFVGRLSPHKRQDAVIHAFGLYRRHLSPGARLRLVGGAVSAAFGERLRALAERLAPGAVSFEEGLTDAALGDRYRRASAFLCLSEHEGFCLPLVEAMRFGLPAVAAPLGAVPETLGDAGLLLGPGDDLAVTAELLHLAVTDTGLREELRRRAPARLAAYDPDAAAGRMRAVIETVAQTGSWPGGG